MISLYPAYGATVRNENGITIPSTGVIVTLTDYYLDLLDQGLLLTYDPLGINSATEDEFVGGILRAALCTDLTTRSGNFDGAVLITQGYSSYGDGGGGRFVWQDASTTTIDNGIVFGNSATGRWKRIYEGPINAKWFGIVGDGVTNDTTKLQAALTSASNSILEIPSGTYICGPLNAVANTRIIMYPGCVIRGNATTITSTNRLFNISVANVSIQGYGATIEIIGSFSDEQNHAIYIQAASGRVELAGITAKSAGGDGIYVKSANADVTTRDITADTCRRNGLSIVQCQSFTDFNGRYINTTGTQPSCGVDIEPNNSTDVLGKIRFYGSYAGNNDAGGFFIYLAAWNSTSNIADIEFHNCKSYQNGVAYNTGGFDVSRVTNTTPCSGLVRFTDCTSIRDGGTGFKVLNKNATLRVEMIRPTVIDSVTRADAGASSTSYGGITLYNDTSYTTNVGNVLIDSPVVILNSGSGSLMQHAIWVHSAGGSGTGHGNVRVSNPDVSGTYGNANAISHGSSEKFIQFETLNTRYVDLISNTTLTDGRYMGGHTTLTNRGASGTISITLPAATAARAGWYFDVHVVAAQTINLTPGAGDTISPIGSGAADPITSNTPGSTVRVRCTGLNEWRIVNLTGTWS